MNRAERRHFLVFSRSGPHARCFVNRIAKGANPGDVPIERTSRFELVANLKAARALGLKIPPAVLLRADRAIE